MPDDLAFPRHSENMLNESPCCLIYVPAPFRYGERCLRALTIKDALYCVFRDAADIYGQT